MHNIDQCMCVHNTCISVHNTDLIKIIKYLRDCKDLSAADAVGILNIRKGRKELGMRSVVMNTFVCVCTFSDNIHQFLIIQKLFLIYLVIIVKVE